MMAKFGKLISGKKPTLIVFMHEEDKMGISEDCRDIAATFGNDAKVVKIDPVKNPQLCRALYIDKFPSFIIYKRKEELFRKIGDYSNKRLQRLIKRINNAL